MEEVKIKISLVLYRALLKDGVLNDENHLLSSVNINDEYLQDSEYLKLKELACEAYKALRLRAAEIRNGINTKKNDY